MTYVLADLDGTLIDSHASIVRAWRWWAARHDVDPAAIERIMLGRPSGVGYAISVYFQLFDVTGVLGYALTFTLLMFAIEFLMLQPLETHVRRWRPVAV